MSIIPQTLNINNLRTTSTKSVNLHTIRKLIEYSLKNVLVKSMFTLTAFEILLFEGRPPLSPAQWGTGNETANNSLFSKTSWSRPQNMSWILDIFKMSWEPTNVNWKEPCDPCEAFLVKNIYFCNTCERLLWRNSLQKLNSHIVIEKWKVFLLYPEAATGGVLQEKVFLEILQNSQENTCARVSFLIKLQAWGSDSVMNVSLWILRKF